MEIFRLYNTIVFCNYKWSLSIWSIKIVSPLTIHISDYFFLPGSTPGMWQLPTQIAKGNWNYFKLSEFRVIGVKITVKVEANLGEISFAYSILRGRRNMLLFSRMNWARLTSNDKRQVDSRLRVIYYFSSPGRTVKTVCIRTYKRVISTKVNFS